MIQPMVIRELGSETISAVTSVAKAIPFLAVYIIIILGCMILWRFFKQKFMPNRGYNALKTVTFGDESTVVSNMPASIMSVLLVFLAWGSFTGSSLLPGFLQMPGAYKGQDTFEYTLKTADGSEDTATVTVLVHEAGTKPKAPSIVSGDGLAMNDVLVVQAYRSKLLLWDKNDGVTRKDGAEIIAVNGKAISKGNAVNTGFARVAITDKGTLNVQPNDGWQMESIWLPAPEQVWNKLIKISTEGYQNVTLAQHLGFSLWRVVFGFLIGALVGIPMGYAMGLSDWFRGWFDPIVEFMRPVPPLALIPLVIIWAGIGEEGKIILIFLAALWIMAIAARSGVSGVRITKIHAAYSLGASKWQILRRVIVPNSLPEIFTGARVAMGVCWGTVVAAELVAAEKGIGKMIVAAAKFQDTDIVLMGIILIGVIGFSIDVGIRQLEKFLVPWKGKG